MMRGDYSPSLFSRAIWFLLSINSFAGVALGGGSQDAIVLAFIYLLGSVAVFLVSIKKGSREFGKIEAISLALFVLSCVIWVVFDAPVINLMISLVAHFIGGVPTITRTLRKPSSEKALHWYFFCAASLMAAIGSPEKTFAAVLFPVYFALFDGLIILLVNRRFVTKKLTSIVASNRKKVVESYSAESI
ncbi:hypothetical protein CSA80_01940 [Candidatus Saccharibacteria bacterium]|nr:MAG: hypothetical protein CSA80_01940 [Candidatus Saccharibacteria bacterium]